MLQRLARARVKTFLRSRASWHTRLTQRNTRELGNNKSLASGLQTFDWLTRLNPNAFPIVLGNLEVDSERKHSSRQVTSCNYDWCKKKNNKKKTRESITLHEKPYGAIKSRICAIKGRVNAIKSRISLQTNFKTNARLIKYCFSFFFWFFRVTQCFYKTKLIFI